MQLSLFAPPPSRFYHVSLTQVRTDYAEHTAREMAREMGRTPAAFKKWLSRRGIRKPRGD